MLKHASTTGGGPANGQLRNTTTSNTSASAGGAVGVTGTSTGTVNGTGTGRSIHLRPPQPLNISTLSAASLQSATVAAAVTTTPNCSTANGGQRIPTLLNIAGTPTAAANTATTTGPATITANNVNTPITPNGIGNNLHTYTNQHVIAAHTNINNSTTPIAAITHPTANNINHNTHNNNNNNNNNNHNYSNCNNLPGVLINQSKHGPGPREALTSLGLLCLVSLLLALLSLIFLLKISPNGREDAMSRSPSEDFVIVYDVTLALCALSLSLNLCCLLVCAIQFLFAVKLVRSPMFDGRDNKYLEKSSVSRTCAVGGFFISIPIFLTGIILYTFNHFHSTPAIITSVLIGIGIVFCGGAMVHNVFVWQKEKTISYRSPPLHTMSMLSHVAPMTPPIQFLSTQHITPTSPPTLNHSAYSYNPHPISVTPVSPNHSHGSFNPLVGNAISSSSFLMRPSTATPPTPKPLNINGTAAAGLTLNAREASGSVSPGIPPTLDMSNITSTSLHELSTLV